MARINPQENLNTTNKSNYMSNGNNAAKLLILPTKVTRAMAYINREIRKILNWKTEEEVTIIVAGRFLLLYKTSDYSDPYKALEKALEEFSKIKKG